MASRPTHKYINYFTWTRVRTNRTILCELITGNPDRFSMRQFIIDVFSPNTMRTISLMCYAHWEVYVINNDWTTAGCLPFNWQTWNERDLPMPLPLLRAVPVINRKYANVNASTCVLYSIYRQTKAINLIKFPVLEQTPGTSLDTSTRIHGPCILCCDGGLTFAQHIVVWSVNVSLLRIYKERERIRAIII